ncbi:hypothetical protein BU26DRAFT_428910 [Trematosphaeria pertusa]|uniref:Uncharacterized protein n=1 Tax=Trematosphaeria pertusa TaxID=390896 RepID=A0A6A6ICY3_9PLEO|nr:uncharacterized protein BU26DRAFT_428910 [Trematosphaeria pertusa]KAF2247918.1 hypothetical protein BU26DRAFT_428910 [Trematosphaeria pertusa]
MIYNVLPAVVQNRIPTLPSIRQSLSDIRIRTLHAKHIDAATDISPPATPPPGYTSRPGSARSHCSSVVSTDGESTLHDDVSERPESLMSTPPPFSVFESKTGINWKYANQGISLTTQAYQESHALARRPDDTATVLTRQLYLHGMTYLLRGLPADLTPEETLSLQAAIPQGLVNIQNEPDAHAVVPFTQDNPMACGAPSDASILHRVTAVVVFQTFITIQFLLPYLRLFAGHAYQFERQHKVTQRVVSNGIMTADALRRRSLQLSHTICQMNDGKVGQAINDLTLWWVRGLTGGLQQGIADGVTVFSNERFTTSKGRVEKVD